MATYIIGLLLSLIIFFIILYYVVKAAVKSGLAETNQNNDNYKSHPVSIQRPEPKNLSASQVELQKRYESGELTFEDYRNEWNKI